MASKARGHPGAGRRSIRVGAEYGLASLLRCARGALEGGGILGIFHGFRMGLLMVDSGFWTEDFLFFSNGFLMDDLLISILMGCCGG